MVNVGGGRVYFIEADAGAVVRAWVEELGTETSHSAHSMWEGIRNICSERYVIDRSVHSLRSFWMRAQAQRQKLLATSKTVSSVLMKSSGHATTEVVSLLPHKRSWREHIQLTSSTSIDNIADFNYVDMDKYLAQQPKLRDVEGSGAATEGERAIHAAWRHMRRAAGNTVQEEGSVESSGGAGRLQSDVEAEPQSSEGQAVGNQEVELARSVATDGSEGQSSWMRRSGTETRPKSVRARKEADRRNREDALFTDSSEEITSRFDTVSEALMLMENSMANSQTGETMNDMERAMTSSLPHDNPLYKKIMLVTEKRWEKYLLGAGEDGYTGVWRGRNGAYGRNRQYAA